MGREDLLDLPFVLVDERPWHCQLPRQGLNGQAVGEEQRDIMGQGHPRFEQRHPPGNEILRAAVGRLPSCWPLWNERA